MSDQRSTSSDGNATDVARREGEHLTGSARDAAAAVGDTVTQHGQRLRRDAREHARNLAHDAQRQVRSHAQEETRRAGAALSTAGDQLRALAEGRVDDAGVLGDYVDQAADAVNRWAHAVQDRGLDGLLDDVRAFGRRRPGMFLAGALAAGIVAGRFGRNASQELGNDNGPQQSDAPRRASAVRGDGGRATSRPSGDDTTGSAAAHAWEPVGGLAGSGDENIAHVGHDAAPPMQEPPPSDGHGSSDDVIVGYASDDSAVVVEPGHEPLGAGGPTAEPSHTDSATAGDGVAYRAIDVEQDSR